jgi:hypothetical protein
MAKFKYKETKQMEARDGNPFATVYYPQTLEQKTATYKHAVMVAKETVRVCEKDPDLADWVKQPLKKFKRTGGKPNYTSEDIVQDMVKQLDTDKDIPSGMLGRWNRLFEDTAWDIELEQETAEPKNLFNDIFKDDDE